MRTSSGTVTPISYPGAVQTQLAAINDLGTVVGSYTDSTGLSHGFLYQPDGTYSTFDTPFADSRGTSVTGINNRGDIVGSSGSVPFIFIDGRLDTLPLLPSSINDSDQMLMLQGFRGVNIYDYRSNTLYQMNSDAAVLAQQSGRLNNSGVIVTGTSGVVLYPAPEPAAAFLVLPALAGLAIWSKRRR